jgi:hypothetical protein
MTFRPLLSTIAQIFLASLLLCGASLLAQTHSFTVFSAPDAGKQTGQGTIPVAINDKGVIAGYYIDSANHSHGFIRETDGTITEFDPLGITDAQSAAINNRSEIVGYGTSNHGTTQGFLRRDGIGRSLLHIMVANSNETLPLGVNDDGVVTGFYQDFAFGSHGFVFDLVTGLTLFDDPDAGFQEPGFGTRAEVINRGGTIAGHYEENNVDGLTHGFVRDSLGNFTNFDAEGANAFRFFCTAINLSGQIAGYYQNVGAVPRSFFRDASGNVTNFSVTGSTDTTATGMNDAGTIVGHWNDSAFTTHGFIRNASGPITTFDAPVPNLGTFPTGINNRNQIIGLIYTGTGVHAFVR